MRELFRTEKITENIIRIRMPGEVFTYLVRGNKGAILIDTGCGLGELRVFVESLLEGMPYEVVLTHGHLDHAGGAIQFDRVWLQEKDWEMAANENSKAARAGYIRQNGMSDFDDEDLDAPRKDGYLPLKYGQIFDIGGEQLEIINLAGHSYGSIGILFQEERILLTGDACCSFALLLSEGGPAAIRSYRSTLNDAWKNYQGLADTMLYSHPHNVGGPEIIPQMIDLCDEILEGKDDHIPMEFMGRKAYLAKAMDDHLKRADGKMANLVYLEGKR